MNVIFWACATQVNEMSVVQEMMSESLKQSEFGRDEFQYRPMPPLVPVSMAFVCLSMLAGLSDLLLIVPLVGIVLAFIAYYQISKSQGELSGGPMALSSLVLMLAIFIAFAGLHLHSYATEIPPGFQGFSCSKWSNGSPRRRRKACREANLPQGLYVPLSRNSGFEAVCSL